MNPLLRLFLDWRFRRSTWIDQHGIRWVKTEIGLRDFVHASVRLRRTRLTAEAYLHQHQDEYPWGKLWLEHGTNFPAPPKALCAELINNNGLGKAGACYRNTLHLGRYLVQCKDALDKSLRESVLYAEGLAVDPTGVYPHAWLIINGKVFDPTWPEAYLATYYGITFDPLWAHKTAKKVGKIGMVGAWEKFESHVRSKLEETH